MYVPTVVMCSMFKSDADRQLVDRVEHLLAKAESYPALRWVWVVGDSTDGTAQILRDLTIGYDDVTIVDIGDTGVVGDDAESRLRCLSVTGNHYFRHGQGADYCLIHESDIISPSNIVNLLVAHAENGRCPIAAWPVLEIAPGRTVFYDVMAYRKDGQRFRNNAPYHPCYRADRPFTVDSAGTILLFHGEDVGSVSMDKRAVLDLCWHLRQLGRDIWVDPKLEVVQPSNLWQYHKITGVYA